MACSRACEKIKIRFSSNREQPCSLLLPCLLKSTALRVGATTLYNAMFCLARVSHNLVVRLKAVFPGKGNCTYSNS